MKLTINETINQMKEYAKELHIPILRPQSSQILCDNLKKNNPKNVLEIGTAIGYSALLILSSCDCNLTTIEKDEHRFNIAQNYIKKLNLWNRVQFVLGDANEEVKNLNKVYDFIFLDGPKSHYIKQLPYLIEHLEIGGIIFADNVLFMGQVLSEDYPAHKHRTAIFRLREFLQAVKNNRNLISELIEVEDGILLIKKIK